MSVYIAPNGIVMKYITDKKHEPDKQEKQSIEREKMESQDPKGIKPTKVRGKKTSELPGKKDPHTKWDGM